MSTTPFLYNAPAHEGPPPGISELQCECGLFDRAVTALAEQTINAREIETELCLTLFATQRENTLLLEAVEAHAADASNCRAIRDPQHAVIWSLRHENAMLRTLHRQYQAPRHVRTFNAAHPIIDVASEVTELKPALNGLDKYGRCPFCDAAAALHIFVDFGAFYCAHCHAAGDAYTFVGLYREQNEALA